MELRQLRLRLQGHFLDDRRHFLEPFLTVLPSELVHRLQNRCANGVLVSLSIARIHGCLIKKSSVVVMGWAQIFTAYSHGRTYPYQLTTYLGRCLRACPWVARMFDWVANGGMMMWYSRVHAHTHLFINCVDMRSMRPARVQNDAPCAREARRPTQHVQSVRKGK